MPKPTGILTDSKLAEGTDKQLPVWFPAQQFVPDINILNSDYYFWMGFEHCRQEAKLAYKTKEIMTKLQGWLDFNEMVPKHLRLAQGRQELEKFCSVLQKISPHNICLEIGVYYGGTFYLWKQFFDQVVGIDTSRELCELVTKQLAGYGCDPTTSHLICGSSQSTETVTETKSYLNGKQIDLLFIDGAHGYEALKMDFEFYLPFVRIGGIIGMHDVGDENAPHGSDKPTPPGFTPTFENLNRCAMDVNRDSERYGITKLQFIHIDHGGIGWCTKTRQVDNYG